MEFDSDELIPIQRDFQVIISPKELSISADVIEVVDSIWQKAVEQPGSKLFDGKILCANTISPNTLNCSVMPYRFFYAQRQSSLIREALAIQIVAVSGIIMHDNLLYFGRRSSSNTQYQNFIELVPSGSLDPNLMVSNNKADFRQQLIEELKEELGIDNASVAGINPLYLIFDQQESTWDICCQIALQATLKVNIVNKSRSQEYKEILAIPLSQSADFIKTNAKNIVPTTSIILQKFLSNLKTQPRPMPLSPG